MFKCYMNQQDNNVIKWYKADMSVQGKKILYNVTYHLIKHLNAWEFETFNHRLKREGDYFTISVIS